MPVQAENMETFEGELFSKEGDFAKIYADIRKKVTPDKLKQYAQLKDVNEKLKFLDLFGGGAHFLTLKNDLHVEMSFIFDFQCLK